MTRNQINESRFMFSQNLIDLNKCLEVSFWIERALGGMIFNFWIDCTVFIKRSTFQLFRNVNLNKQFKQTCLSSTKFNGKILLHNRSWNGIDWFDKQVWIWLIGSNNSIIDPYALASSIVNISWYVLIKQNMQEKNCWHNFFSIFQNISKCFILL